MASRTVTFAQIAAFGAIAFAGIALRGDLPATSPSWADWLFIGLTIVLLAWCVQSRVAKADTEGHEQPGEGFAFRLGKKLSSVRRRLRG